MATRPGVMERIVRNFINSLFTLRKADKLVGKDKFGNIYLEKHGDHSHNLRSARYILQKDKTNWDSPEIPVEWEAWLRGRRKEPPTEEEIEQNYIKMMQTKMRAGELERKYADEKKSAQVPAKAVGENINPSQDNIYAEYENAPGEKYKQNNKIK